MAIPNQFEAAIEALRVQLGLSEDELDDMRLEVRRRAMEAAQAAEASMLHQVHKSLLRSFQLGQGIAEWRKAIKAQVSRAWFGKNATRLTTIYRNEVQRALNGGRFVQMTRPRVLRLRPYWMFDAVDDTRTTDICEDRDGFIAAADNPWWTINYPTLHHRCRSGVRTLTERQAKRKGLGDSQSLTTEPQKGFGKVPGYSDPVPVPSSLAEPIRRALSV